MNTTTTKQYLRLLSLFGLALVSGQAVFCVVLLLLHFTQPHAAILNEQTAQITLLISAVVTLGAALAGQTLFRNKVRAARENNDLGNKLQAYRDAVVVRYAIWEGPSLLSMVFFYLTNDYLFFAPVVLILALFLINRPTKGSIAQHLQLPDQERMLLNDDHAVLY